MHKQIINILDQELVKPAFGPQNLVQLIWKEISLSALRLLQEDYAAVSGEQIKKLMQEYFVKDNSYEIITVPVSQ